MSLLFVIATSLHYLGRFLNKVLIFGRQFEIALLQMLGANLSELATFFCAFGICLLARLPDAPKEQVRHRPHSRLNTQ